MQNNTDMTPTTEYQRFTSLRPCLLDQCFNW